MIGFIRSAFNDQKWFRLFVVLQILFIVVLIIYDLTSDWDLIFTLGVDDIEIDSSLYSWYGEEFFGNYLTLATIFLPFYIAKSVDWILSSKDNK